LREVQNSLEQVRSEKQQLESTVKFQRQQLDSLKAANDVLNARVASWAAEQDMARGEDPKVKGLKESLKKAQDEIDAMRMAESTQRVALLDELTSLSTDNAKLREQLRAEQRKNEAK
jgi:hypothetical protein